MLEEERKYEVDPGFTLPDLTSLGRVVARPPKTLRATYYDTADLRLARAGVSLRFRRGDREPWTVKLPAGVPGIRHEISRPGVPSVIPADLLDLVTVWRRGAPVAPVTVVRSKRRGYDVSGLAEIADDTVSVLDGRRVVMAFRELEVERTGGDREVLDRIEVLLGVSPSGEFTPKHVRALGPAALLPPDLPPPVRVRHRNATAGEVAVAAIRTAVDRILTHDPLVRLRSPVGDDDTAVHQMRVGCRRLRSDLRTFGVLLDRAWVGELRGELRWLADLLGAARDAEVLRKRLSRRTRR